MVSDRAEEIDTVAHAGRSGDCLQTLLLALISVADVFAENDEPNVVVFAISKQRQRADGDIDALETFEPADEQHQPARSVADLAPSVGAIERLERGQVDARSHHVDVLR